MDKVVGNLDNNGQGVFMKVVHPTHVGLDEDHVIKLWRVAYRGLGAGYVYHGLRWFLCLL